MGLTFTLSAKQFFCVLSLIPRLTGFWWYIKEILHVAWEVCKNSDKLRIVLWFIHNLSFFHQIFRNCLFCGGLRIVYSQHYKYWSNSTTSFREIASLVRKWNHFWKFSSLIRFFNYCDNFSNIWVRLPVFDMGRCIYFFKNIIFMLSDVGNIHKNYGQ